MGFVKATGHSGGGGVTGGKEGVEVLEDVVSGLATPDASKKERPDLKPRQG